MTKNHLTGLMKKAGSILLFVTFALCSSCSNDERDILNNEENIALLNLYEKAAEQTLRAKDHGITPDSAQAIAGLLIKTAQSFENEYNNVRAGILSSWYYFEKWQVDTARQILEQNLTFFQNHPDYSQNIDHGRSLYIHSKVHFRSREMQMAKKCAKDALKIFEQIGDLPHMSSTFTILGAIDFMLSDYPEAFENYSNAQAINEKLGIPFEEQTSLMYNITLVLKMMGEYAKVLDYSYQLMRIHEEKGNHDAQLLVMNSLGNLYSEKLKNQDSALYYYGKCQEIAKLQGNVNRYYLTEINIIKMYANFENYKVSNNLVNAILSADDEVPAWVKEEAVAINAQNYLILGDFENSVLKGTIALKKSIEQGGKEEIIDRAEILVRAYQNLGKYDSAFYYLKTIQIYKDSIFNIENQRKLSSFYAEIETLEKQKEIEILQKEQKLQEAESLNKIITILGGSTILILILLAGILAYRNRSKRHLLQKYEVQTELDKRIKDLNRQSLKIIQKDQNLAEIELGLKKIKSNLVNGSQMEVQKILNSITVNKSIEKEWEKFDEYFGNSNSSFYNRISECFPDLTISEKRLSTLIKMDLTNGEIANIMNIEKNSVRMAKYRLKKKFNLSDEQSIISFLNEL